MKDIKQSLLEALSSPRSILKEEEPLGLHTTFRIGGPAQWYAAPDGEKELRAVLEICRREGLPVRVLGNGSDLLVSDQGCRGVVVSMMENWSSFSVSGSRLRAGAGLLLSKAASAALKEGLTGLEFASGIPGTVGGACVMNAGAYGSEMKDVVVSVRVMDREGKIRTLEGEELGFGYRTSAVGRMDCVILEAEFALKPGEPATIRQTMEELAARRREKQPLEYPSAGSTFKRPEGYFAGKLIQDAGLRGVRVGDAQVSEKHCGFVINRGNATAAQVMELCRRIQDTVYQRDGVRLEMEIRRWGDF